MWLQKDFGGKIFTGTVIDVDVDKKGKTMWRVRYEDDDEEDLYEEELRPLLGIHKMVNAQRFFAVRKRSINLFTHYPVLDITIKPGRLQQKDRFFNGDYSVKLAPLTPFPPTYSGTVDPFQKMFGTGNKFVRVRVRVTITSLNHHQ